jgi:hypothetical protein
MAWKWTETSNEEEEGWRRRRGRRRRSLCAVQYLYCD